MSSNNNQFGLRLNFENAKTALIKAGVSPSTLQNAVLSQSTLRLEQLLNLTQSTFTFPVLSNQTGSGTSVRVTEVRLNQQDAFYVTSAQIFLSPATTTTTAALQLLTYPNSVSFATGSLALYTFYNGQLKITINNSVITPAYPMSDFLNIPQTQLTAATNSPISEFHGLSKVVLEPNPVFVGVYNTVVQIVMPAAFTALDANTYAIIILHGILAQNVALGAT